MESNAKYIAATERSENEKSAGASKMAANAAYIASTEKRRASKPQIEKRRRARINKSLKNLVEMLAPPGRTSSESRTPRMEKAQILEMTVDYVKKAKQSRLHPEMPSCNKHETSFQDGYKSCQEEVYNFFQKSSGRPSDIILFQSLDHYLSQKLKPQSSSNCSASISCSTSNNSNTSSSNINEKLNKLKLGVPSSTHHKVFETKNNVLNSAYFKANSPKAESSSSHSLASIEDDSISNVYESDCSISERQLELGQRIRAQNEINNNIVCNTEPNVMWRPW